MKALGVLLPLPYYIQGAQYNSLIWYSGVTGTNTKVAWYSSLYSSYKLTIRRLSWRMLEALLPLPYYIQVAWHSSLIW